MGDEKTERLKCAQCEKNQRYGGRAVARLSFSEPHQRPKTNSTAHTQEDGHSCKRSCLDIAAEKCNEMPTSQGQQKLNSFFPQFKGRANKNEPNSVRKKMIPVGVGKKRTQNGQTEKP